MSRGPGRWQRTILAAIEAHPTGVVITSPDDSTAEQSALRRAAVTLRDAGKIILTSQSVYGRPRLVAYPSDSDVPPFHYVTGGDGKLYMLPGGGIVHGPDPSEEQQRVRALETMRELSRALDAMTPGTDRDN